MDEDDCCSWAGGWTNRDPVEDFLPETEMRLEEISYVPVTQSIRLERVISQAVLQQSCYTLQSMVV